MREQQAHITEVFVGPVELFVAAWCKPPQHNEHCLGWKHAQFMADCKIRHARVREAARTIIAARNARNEVAYQQAAEYRDDLTRARKHHASPASSQSSLSPRPLQIKPKGFPGSFWPGFRDAYGSSEGSKLQFEPDEMALPMRVRQFKNHPFSLAETRVLPILRMQAS